MTIDRFISVFKKAVAMEMEVMRDGRGPFEVRYCAVGATGGAGDLADPARKRRAWASFGDRGHNLLADNPLGSRRACLDVYLATAKFNSTGI
tara:strand:+ start:528 stop:803 length:276 start_codon:yes stop_codon:yes gene_type:complete